MLNRDELGAELDALIGHLEEYRAALSAGDAQALERLLREGRERKDIVDRREDEP